MISRDPTVVLVVARVMDRVTLSKSVIVGVVSVTALVIRLRLRDGTASCASQQATDQTPRRAIAWIQQNFQWRRLGTDRETRANAVREFEAVAIHMVFRIAIHIAIHMVFRIAIHMTFRIAPRFPCCDMRTHRAAECFGVRERHARVSESNRFAHQFFGMTRAFEKGVIAGDFDFAPTHLVVTPR